MFDTDVFVIGGGPAGLVAAIAARLAGLRVVVADAERPPIDKPCGEGLMPDSLSAVHRLGIEVTPEHGNRFRGIRFSSPDHSVAADFPNGYGIGVRRLVLHRLLVERASQLGVELLWSQPVTGLAGNNISLGLQTFTTRWVVGADGTQSRVRRWAGLDKFRRDSQRFSYRRHFRIAPWSEYMEIHWGRHSQFYVTPVNRDEISLVLMSRNPRKRIADALPDFPFLKAKLSGSEPISTERGALAATRQLRRVSKNNVVLIGDASGTVDPVTGEGLCLSFKQASALADALTREDLRLYERAHARLTSRPRFMSDFMLLMDRSDILRARTLAAFESHPYLFANLLAMHVGQLPKTRFLTTAAALGWQVATA